jgi:general secretion pathway protein B
LPAPAQVAPVEPPPVQPVFTSEVGPLRLADLSSDERQQLPALKVSMHMWASDAANRFAIIDGTRVNEGDRLGPATVEAIEQDGVLLSWQGRRIRLPIR